MKSSTAQNVSTHLDTIRCSGREHDVGIIAGNSISSFDELGDMFPDYFDSNRIRVRTYATPLATLQDTSGTLFGILWERGVIQERR